jgi:hypothetical protein
VVGLSYVARRESFRGPIPCWPLLLLAAPVILGLLMNTGHYLRSAGWTALLFAVWTTGSLWTAFTGRPVNVGRIVTNLLAGIVLVDWLAVGPQLPTGWGALLFLGLFGLTKWLQKFVPAT